MGFNGKNPELTGEKEVIVQRSARINQMDDDSCYEVPDDELDKTRC